VKLIQNLIFGCVYLFGLVPKLAKPNLGYLNQFWSPFGQIPNFSFATRLWPLQFILAWSADDTPKTPSVGFLFGCFRQI